MPAREDDTILLTDVVPVTSDVVPFAVFNPMVRRPGGPAPSTSKKPQQQQQQQAEASDQDDAEAGTAEGAQTGSHRQALARQLDVSFTPGRPPGGGSAAAQRGAAATPGTAARATPSHVQRNMDMYGSLRARTGTQDRTRSRVLGRAAVGVGRAETRAALAAMKAEELTSWTIGVVIAVSPEGALAIAIPTDPPGLEEVFNALTGSKAVAPLAQGRGRSASSAVSGRENRANSSSTIVTDWRLPSTAQAAVAAAAAAGGGAEGADSSATTATGPSSTAAPRAVDPIVLHKLRVERLVGLAEPAVLLIGLVQVAVGFARIVLLDPLGSIPSFGALVIFIAAAYNQLPLKSLFLVHALAMIAICVAQAVQTAQAISDLAAAGEIAPSSEGTALTAGFPLYVPPDALGLCYAQIAISVLQAPLAAFFTLISALADALANPRAWDDARVLLESSVSVAAGPSASQRRELERRRAQRALWNFGAAPGAGGGIDDTADADLMGQASVTTTRELIVGDPRVCFGLFSAAGLLGISPGEISARARARSEWVSAPSVQPQPNVVAAAAAAAAVGAAAPGSAAAAVAGAPSASVARPGYSSSAVAPTAGALGAGGVPAPSAPSTSTSASTLGGTLGAWTAAAFHFGSSPTRAAQSQSPHGPASSSSSTTATAATAATTSPIAPPGPSLLGRLLHSSAGAVAGAGDRESGAQEQRKGFFVPRTAGGGSGGSFRDATGLRGSAPASAPSSAAQSRAPSALPSGATTPAHRGSDADLGATGGGGGGFSSSSAPGTATFSSVAGQAPPRPSLPLLGSVTSVGGGGTAGSTGGRLPPSHPLHPMYAHQQLMHGAGVVPSPIAAPRPTSLGSVASSDPAAPPMDLAMRGGAGAAGWGAEGGGQLTDRSVASSVASSVLTAGTGGGLAPGPPPIPRRPTAAVAQR